MSIECACTETSRSPLCCHCVKRMSCASSQRIEHVVNAKKTPHVLGTQRQRSKVNSMESQLQAAIAQQKRPGHYSGIFFSLKYYELFKNVPAISPRFNIFYYAIINLWERNFACQGIYIRHDLISIEPTAKLVNVHWTYWFILKNIWKYDMQRLFADFSVFQCTWDITFNYFRFIYFLVGCLNWYSCSGSTHSYKICVWLKKTKRIYKIRLDKHS